MDIHTNCKIQQQEIRNYYDKSSTSTLVKRPYHFFASHQKPIYKETHPECTSEELSKKLSQAWRRLEYSVYIKYLQIALNDKQTKLTHRGFEVYKPMYPESVLNQFRKDLSVTPRVVKGYGPPPESYDLFTENDEYMMIPRYYGWEKLDHPEKIPHQISKGQEINVSFTGTLREYQMPAIRTFEQLFHTKGGGILEAGCGTGKTSMALYMICMLNRKTLVIVHKENLLLQWKDRIRQFIPSARIGLIQGSTIDVEDKDIVIGMIQSLCKKDYGDLFHQFGFLISDETHRTSAKEFCKALQKATTYYTLGLTATPTRADGLTKVFKWYLGETGFVLKKKSEFKVTARAIYYESEHYVEKKMYTGSLNYANMIGQISDNQPRTEMVCNLVRSLILNENRRILMIGHRLNLLKSLDKMIKARNTLKEMVTVGYYVGGMKEQELLESTKQQIILGTYAMIEEGADIPILDTVVLLTPKGTVQQTVGRILRQQNQNNPLIVDIIDMFSVFPRQALKRKKYYEKERYQLVGYIEEKPQQPHHEIPIETLFNDESD